MNYGLYAVYVIMGTGITASAGAVVGAVDYFTYVFPDYDVERWLSLTLYSATLLVVIIRTLAPSLARNLKRDIILGSLIFTVGNASIPIVDVLLIRDEKGTALSFAILLCISTTIGIASGLVEGSLVGISLSLTETYYHAVSVGIGNGFLVMILLRMATKAAFSDAAGGLHNCVYIFFGTAASLCFLCALLQRFVLADPISSRPLTIPNPEDSETRPLSTTAADMNETGPTTEYISFGSETLVVAQRLRAVLFSVFFNYFVTFAIFPGIASDVDNPSLGDWYKLFVVMVFSASDVVFRWFSTRVISKDSSSVIISALLRVFIAMAIFFAIKNNASPILLLFLVALLGGSCGYVTVCCFALSHKQQIGMEKSAVAGNLFTICLVGGIAFGCVAALGWSAMAS